MTGRAVVTIPVVVHVVWNTSAENISDEQIHSQIEVLNQDFNAQNSQIATVPNGFQAAIADVDFEFCLASKDPLGNPTTGITRTQTSNNIGIGGTAAIHRSSQGGQDAWDTDRYLNIWVAKFQGSIGGIASFPGEGPADEQGVEINYKQFGTIGTATNPPYHLGRTCTHEIGHYFNLEHVWGPSLNSCCDEDDGVSDTPNSCETYIDQCPSGTTFSCAMPDMWMNFMNYTDDACMAMFTKGQKERMYVALNTFRPGLLNADGCQTVGLEEVIAKPIIEVLGNPFVDELKLRINASDHAAWDLQVWDAGGRLLLQKKLASNHDFELETSALPSGLYLVLASQNGLTISRRVVKLAEH